jgi:F-type H+-transporting ATPase subunit epsilon
MYLEIITPDMKIFEGYVEAATFPGTKGSFQVLRNHAPIISSLAEGLIVYRDENQEYKIKVSGGVVEVLNNNIIALVEKVFPDRF